MSTLVAYVSPLSARIVACTISLGGMYFLFSWSKVLRVPVWSAFLLGLFLLFIPLHRELYTSMLSDFPGFTFLMGWAYFRHVKRPLPAMVCLLVACSMRETHVLPALLFVIVGWKTLDLKKTVWVELVSVGFLTLYYSWAKLSTGYWYPFTGKYAIQYENLANLNWIYATLTILLPLLLVTFLKFLPKNEKDGPFFFRTIFLAPLAVILICIFAPYLATFSKARLLTPFVSFYWLALLYHWHNLKLGHKSKALFFVVIIGFSYMVHVKFVPSPRRVENIREAQQVAQLAMALNLPAESIITGDWPHSMHLTFERLGFIGPGFSILNREYFPHPRNRLAEAHSKVPVVYFVTHKQRVPPKLFIELLKLGCEEIQLISPDQRVWTLYLRNVSAQTVREARDRLWPATPP